MTLEMLRARGGKTIPQIYVHTGLGRVLWLQNPAWHHGGGLQPPGPCPISERVKWRPGMPKEAGLAAEGTPPLLYCVLFRAPHLGPGPGPKAGPHLGEQCPPCSCQWRGGRGRMSWDRHANRRERSREGLSPSDTAGAGREFPRGPGWGGDAGKPGRGGSWTQGPPGTRRIRTSAVAAGGSWVG